jgi:hypothetical protein
MTENTASRLGNVITMDDERIKSHLDRVIRGSVEETLNASLASLAFNYPQFRLRQWLPARCRSGAIVRAT